MKESGTLKNMISHWENQPEDCRLSESPTEKIPLGPEKLISLFIVIGIGYIAAAAAFASELAMTTLIPFPSRSFLSMTGSKRYDPNRILPFIDKRLKG